VEKESRLRIAIIAPPWVPVPPQTYGGTEMVVDALATGLQTGGHDVLLYATGDSACAVPTEWVFATAAGTGSIDTATEIRQVVNAYAASADWRADIVHDHTQVGPLHGARFGNALVTTNHGRFDGDLGDLYRTLSGTVPIIAISRSQAARATSTSIAAVILHGLDLAAYPVGSGDGEYALFVGRMNACKGVDVAARVARRAGLPLRIAAKMREPAEYEYFHDAVEPLLGHGVEYIGEVDHGEKLELLSHASCLLNPIKWPEPFGLVMIEALACGTPVVATPSGSVPEIVLDGETGFVRTAEDALAEQLQRIGSLDRRRCRRDAEERFSTDRMVADHVALYERVATHRHPL
jgi:glycosyltransferase involved in cell wall biosynthesis